MSEPTVTITKKEYDALIRSDKLLTALENGGVDNWEWYSDAYAEAFPEEDEEEEDED